MHGSMFAFFLWCVPCRERPAMGRSHFRGVLPNVYKPSFRNLENEFIYTPRSLKITLAVCFRTSRIICVWCEIMNMQQLFRFWEQHRLAASSFSAANVTFLHTKFVFTKALCSALDVISAWMAPTFITGINRGAACALTMLIPFQLRNFMVQTLKRFSFISARLVSRYDSR